MGEAIRYGAHQVTYGRVDPGTTLHDLADHFELAAIDAALKAGDAAKKPHVLDRVQAKAMEDEALRRFQLADHIRKSATRLQVAQVTGD